MEEMKACLLLNYIASRKIVGIRQFVNRELDNRGSITQSTATILSQNVGCLGHFQVGKGYLATIKFATRKYTTCIILYSV